MKIIITEEQKNNLFKPRNLESRYDLWNRQQPEITIDGKVFKFNQYDNEGNNTGLWVETPETIEQDYIKTKSFFKDIFDNLKVVNKNGYTNYIIGDEIYFQDPKNGYLWFSYSKIWKILEDQYSLNSLQIRGLVSIWMEMTYKLGSLTPRLYNCWNLQRMEMTYKLGSLTPYPQFGFAFP